MACGMASGATERRSNSDPSIPHGLAQLETSGALGQLPERRAGSGAYRGGLDDAGVTFPFLDTDVYKWLEAVGWEWAGRGRGARGDRRPGHRLPSWRPSGRTGTSAPTSS